MIKTMITGVAILLASTFPVFSEERQEKKCLAMNIYFEARGEPISGQYAVADVTLNRVESSQYPNSICNVVFQCSSNGCQFSWASRVNDINTVRMYEQEAWEQAKEIAATILREDKNRGITAGATHFHANYVTPAWSRSFERTFSVGAHHFYRGS